VDTLTFLTEDGVRLEGELRLPEGQIRGTAVVCHPHPRYGGSKDHPILWSLRIELAARRGFAVLLFNFRGVMGSGGTFAGGHAELLDVRAALDRVREVQPDAPTLLCGWSFGANVALRESLDDERVGALALIGLPLDPKDVTLPELPSPSVLKAFRRPVLLLTGEEDEFCPSEELRSFGANLPRGEVRIVEGTNHYLWLRDKEAAAIVGDFAERVLV
jgi:uncharacterized protein